MFGTIRRHSTWLWVLIITFTVISFVFFFSPNQKAPGGGRDAQNGFGVVKGKEVTRDDYRSAQSEVYLHYFLTRGQWPDQDPMAKQMGFDPQRETYFRILLIREQEAFNIHVSENAVNQTAGDILRSASRDGSVTLESFEAQVLKPRNLSLLDFENFLRHELGNQQLIATVGLPGKLITPQEAEKLYRQENEDVSAEVAYFAASNYMAGVNVNSNALAQYHKLHEAEYRIPERIQVNYVTFNLADFMTEADAKIAKMTNVNEIVNATYNQRGGTNFYRELTPDAAKAKIKEELRENEARGLARQKANIIADPLLSAEAPKPEMFSAVAASNGLTVKISAPLSYNDETNELKLLPKMAQMPFDLTADSPFAGPLDGEDAVLMIGLNKLLPSENPPLESIREKVVADFKRAQATELARQAGYNFSKGFTNEPSTTDFSIAAVAAKADYIKVPAFSLSTRTLPDVQNKLQLGQLQDVAFATQTGKVSDFVPTQDGGFVMHVSNRTPVSEEKVKQNLPSFVNSVRQSRQNEAFNQWFRKRVMDEPVLRQLASRTESSPR